MPAALISRCALGETEVGGRSRTTDLLPSLRWLPRGSLKAGRAVYDHLFEMFEGVPLVAHGHDRLYLGQGGRVNDPDLNII